MSLFFIMIRLISYYFDFLVLFGLRICTKIFRNFAKLLRTKKSARKQAWIYVSMLDKSAREPSHKRTCNAHVKYGKLKLVNNSETSRTKE